MATEKVEINLKAILAEIKYMGYTNEIPRKYLIAIINKFTTSYMPYMNRLWIDGYLKDLNEHIFKILTLEYKPPTLKTFINDKNE